MLTRRGSIDTLRANDSFSAAKQPSLTHFFIAFSQSIMQDIRKQILFCFSRERD
jgi:hypothetical protein